jgi:TolA-binding protein
MKRIVIRFFIPALFLIFQSFLYCQPAFARQLTIDSEAQFQFALETIERGDYDRAIVELERFLYFFPEDDRVLKAKTLVGFCHLESKSYDKSRKILQEVLQSDPTGPQAGEALFLIGESYHRQGALKEAEVYYKRVIAEHPSSVLKNRALYQLGWNQMKADRWRDASETFNRVETKSPLHLFSQDLSEQSLKGEDLPQKNPVAAGLMAGVMPGLGHAYCNRYKDGLVSFLLNGLFIWGAYEAFEQDHEVLGGILTFFEVGWYSGNIYGAVNCAHKHNRKVKEDFRKNLSDQMKINLFSREKGELGVALNIKF